MATLLSSRAPRAFRARSSLLRPPSLPSRRPFSASTPRKGPIYDFLLSGPNYALTELHSITGLPWCAVIPICAVVVRGVVLYALADRPSHMKSRKFNLLQPIIDSTHFGYEGGLRRMRPSQTWDVKAYWNTLRYRWMATRDVGEAFGLKLIDNRTFASFYVLIFFTEIIRVRCGARQGILSMILAPIDNGWRQVMTWGQQAPAPKPPDELLAEAMEEYSKARAEHEKALLARKGVIPDASQGPLNNQSAVQKPLVEQGLDKSDAAAQTASPSNSVGLNNQSALQELHAEQALGQSETGTQAVSIPDSVASSPADTTPPTEPAVSQLFDPTTQVEGLPWCSDLTLPDPTGTLSVIFMCALWAMILLERDFVQKWYSTGKLPQLSFSQRLRGAGGTLFVLISTKFPAAVLLYIISSWCSGWMGRRWLNYKFPMPPKITRCRLPVRMKEKAEWKDN